MGWSITNIWNLLTYDVEDTIYSVCKAVLDEKDIPKDMRTTRAAAIKAIGVIFQVPSIFHMVYMLSILVTPCSWAWEGCIGR